MLFNEIAVQIAVFSRRKWCSWHDLGFGSWHYKSCLSNQLAIMELLQNFDQRSGKANWANYTWVRSVVVVFFFVFWQFENYDSLECLMILAVFLILVKGWILSALDQHGTNGHQSPGRFFAPFGFFQFFFLRNNLESNMLQNKAATSSFMIRK